MSGKCSTCAGLTAAWQRDRADLYAALARLEVERDDAEERAAAAEERAAAAEARAATELLNERRIALSVVGFFLCVALAAVFAYEACLFELRRAAEGAP